MISNIGAGSQSGLTLITGATGFVGSSVTARLAAYGVETLACVHDDMVSMPEGVRVVPVAELNAKTDWRQVLAGVKSLVHLAARVHVMNDSGANPLTAFRAVNVDGTLNLARQAAAAGVKRFVFISSVKVNGEATLPGQPFTADDIPAPLDPIWRFQDGGRAGPAPNSCRHWYGGCHHLPTAGVRPRCQSQLCRSHARGAARLAIAAGCRRQPAQFGGVGQLSGCYRDLHYPPPSG